MKSFGLLSMAAGALMLGLSGAASAAPVGAALPGLTTLLASENGVEQVQYGRHRHHRRHCRWVAHRGHWHRVCHRH
jgi:hypothetical protein